MKGVGTKEQRDCWERGRRTASGGTGGIEPEGQYLGITDLMGGDLRNQAGVGARLPSPSLSLQICKMG